MGVRVMARHRTGKKTTPPTIPNRAAGPLAHHPFTILRGLKVREAQKPVVERVMISQPKPMENEADLFAAAMSDVTVLKNTGRVRRKSSSGRRPGPRIDENLEVLAHLEDLITGKRQFDLVNTDEYVEGYVRGIHPIVLERLRRGHFSVQAYLDLHGLTVREAEETVADFLTESEGLGYRCVLLIHGRGLNSKDQIPVIKERLESILLRGPVKKKILAFTTAKPHDGGAGASYVLLRAKQK
jgi:DNA-nicking Smr family endonuclease